MSRPRVKAGVNGAFIYGIDSLYDERRQPQEPEKAE